MKTQFAADSAHGGCLIVEQQPGWLPLKDVVGGVAALRRK
jgi:hypothetical protein